MKESFLYEADDESGRYEDGDTWDTAKGRAGKYKGQIRYFDGDNADDAARSVRLRTGQTTAASGKDVATIKIAPSGSNSGYFNSHGGVSLGRNHGRADSSTSSDFIMHISESATTKMIVEGTNIKVGTDGASNSARGILDVRASGNNQGFYVTAGAVGLPTDIVHSSGAGTFDLQPRNFRLGTSSGGPVTIHPKHDSVLKLGTADDNDLLTLSGSTQISGSSTSTGSFGSLVVAGNTSITGTITEASTMRIKTNIETLESPLDKISKLRGVSYNLKKNNEPSIGMIAEEVEKVFPELVSKDDSGKAAAMSYGRMTAVLLEAIKELKEEVDELKQENIYMKQMNRKNK